MVPQFTYPDKSSLGVSNDFGNMDECLFFVTDFANCMLTVMIYVSFTLAYPFACLYVVRGFLYFNDHQFH